MSPGMPGVPWKQHMEIDFQNQENEWMKTNEII